MATGHIQPGYGNLVSKLRRAKSAGSNTIIEDPIEMKLFLRSVKAEAKRVWSAKSDERTTYHGAFGPPEKLEQLHMRPPSPTRRNNPHPPQVFLINRLHFVPGYGNPDATVGKPMYRVDACVSPDELQRRREPRNKFVPTVAPAALSQYRDLEGAGQMFQDSRSRAAAEAYLRVADDERARGGVYNAVSHFESQQRESSRPYTARASIHRYNKMAGQMEMANLYGMREDDVYRSVQPRAASAFVRPPATLLQARQQELTSYSKFRVDPSKRGEFLIHPDWPPSIYHHRLE